MTTFRNNKKKDLISYKTGIIFMHGEILKDRSRSSAIFKKELFATIGNGRKLQRASSNMYRHVTFPGVYQNSGFLEFFDRKSISEIRVKPGKMSGKTYHLHLLY